MAAKKGGLGKGLDSLIPDKKEVSKVSTPRENKETEETSGGIVQMNINEIEPNRDQPRQTFNEDSLEALSENIKLHGVIDPLLVRKRDGYYEIINGERRWRASKMAGLKKVPVMICDPNLSEQEIVEISLIDNLQREDLNEIDEAKAYKKLIDDYGLKQEEVANRVTKSRAAVTNSMRLLKLDERVQQMIVEDIIASTSARALLPLSDGEKQYEMAQRIIDEQLSVRQVEKEVKNILNNKEGSRKEKEGLDPKLEIIYEDLQEQMKNILGTKVVINAKDNKKGRLEIDYYSQEELDRIISLIKSIRR